MSPTPTISAAFTAMDKYNFRAVSVTCILALAISIHFVKRFFQKRNKCCYLTTETEKPQKNFKRILADNSYSQFKHLKVDTDEECSNLHPYKGEISELMKNPNVRVLKFDDCVDLGTDNRPYVWVESEAALRELVEVLSKESVFGVDTEQHSFRSFLGFTALVQISTRTEDYLVDAIALHDVMGLLSPVFANPGICKVFHGADNDVLWLQRDFHIYVVNLFDTAKACDILSKPQRSLAYLLETYCNVATNKLFQRGDWRQRPLSKEMIEYAQTDAKYLLYITHCLASELKLKGNENMSPGDKFHFLVEASRRSNATCSQLFAKDVEDCPGEFAATSIISRCLNDQGNFSSKLCDSKFQEIVRRLCTWRDIMARLHDESLRFVLSDSSIIALAAKSPMTKIDICSTISDSDLDLDSTTLPSPSPSPSPSPVVLCHLDDLLYLLRESSSSKLDHNIFQQFVHRHLLGPGATCPLSAYNYALLANKQTNSSSSNSTYNRFNSSKRVSKKVSREMFVQKFSCKSPVYHNCKIYANDGRLLCYCDRRKLEWYVNRNLAKLVESDPNSIMLLFEPKGRPEDEGNDFYVQSKKNICVGCGEGNHYLRYRIIPSCYRMHFPEHLKSHRSHDIVLLCVDCHEIAHAAAEKYKRKVAAEFGIPLFVRKVVEFEEENAPPTSSFPVEEVGVSPLQLRTAAMALLRHGPRMPEERREELMQIIVEYYGGREISDKDLERALMVGMSPHERRKFGKKRGLDFKHLTNSSINEDENNKRSPGNSNLSDNCNLKHAKLSLLGHGPHGKQVVNKLLEEHGVDGVHTFCQRWRQVFVEALQPRFLPDGWDVMHSGKRDFGDFSVYNPAKKASAVAAT